MDHASYGRFNDRPYGTWHVWLNVINVELEDGASARTLYRAFYGENAGWREIAAFTHCVLTPLQWSGLISGHGGEGMTRADRIYFKTPLWRSVLRLETDNTLVRATLH